MTSFPPQSGPLRDIEGLLAATNASILEALAILDSQNGKIVLIVDENRRLLGVVTDGDVRRHLLKGGSLSAPVTDVMNANPVVAKASWDQHSILVVMRSRGLRQVPVVDDEGRVEGVFLGAERIISMAIDAPVLIMAGGFGTRLAGLTRDTPKPMLEIGGQPMLEVILKSMILQGFGKFYIALHYLASQVVDHFGDGAPWGCSIEYLYEDHPLGTGGALGLLPASTTDVVVVNGDVLTNLDYGALLRTHIEQKADMTVCTRMHQIEVPFGVITQSNGLVKKVVEKPCQEMLVNSGIYVVGARARAGVARDKPLLMTDLINRLLSDRKRVVNFTTTAAWADVGRPGDLKLARAEADRVRRLGWLQDLIGESDAVDEVVGL